MVAEKPGKNPAPPNSSGHSKLKRVAGRATKVGGESGHSSIKKVFGTAAKRINTERDERST